MNSEKEYSVLLSFFVRLIQAQAGQKIEEKNFWLNDAQTLSIKLFYHLVSMKRLSTKESIKDHAITFIDHASLNVVTRAALETYLVFFYIYGSGDMLLSEFRHKKWHMAGLIDRQSFHAAFKEHQETLLAEKKRIDELRSVISSSEYMNHYSEKEKKKILQGMWRIGKGWSDLGVDAGFNETYFKNIYSYLCCYSHSSYVSALQIRDARSLDDQQMLTEPFLTIGVVLMAHFSFSYSHLFAAARDQFDVDFEAKALAEKWRFGPEQMDSIYGKR